MTRQMFWQLIKKHALRGRHHGAAVAAHAAPRLRHPPAEPRRRPARGADAARPRRHLDHHDLHPRGARAAEAAARAASPARLIRRCRCVAGCAAVLLTAFGASRTFARTRRATSEARRAAAGRRSPLRCGGPPAGRTALWCSGPGPGRRTRFAPFGSLRSNMLRQVSSRPALRARPRTLRSSPPQRRCARHPAAARREPPWCSQRPGRAAGGAISAATRSTARVAARAARFVN